MSKIIHNPKELMNLSRDELDKILLEEYNNPALLRELIRVSLLQLNGQAAWAEFYKEKKNEMADKFEALKSEINKVVDNFKC